MLAMPHALAHVLVDDFAVKVSDYTRSLRVCATSMTQTPCCTVQVEQADRNAEWSELARQCRLSSLIADDAVFRAVVKHFGFRQAVAACVAVLNQAMSALRCLDCINDAQWLAMQEAMQAGALCPDLPAPWTAPPSSISEAAAVCSPRIAASSLAVTRMNVAAKQCFQQQEFVKSLCGWRLMLHKLLMSLSSGFPLEVADALSIRAEHSETVRSMLHSLHSRDAPCSHLHCFDISRGKLHSISCDNSRSSCPSTNHVHGKHLMSVCVLQAVSADNTAVFDSILEAAASIVVHRWFAEMTPKSAASGRAAAIAISQSANSDEPETVRLTELVARTGGAVAKHATGLVTQARGGFTEGQRMMAAVRANAKSGLFDDPASSSAPSATAQQVPRTRTAAQPAASEQSQMHDKPARRKSSARNKVRQAGKAQQRPAASSAAHATQQSRQLPKPLQCVLNSEAPTLQQGNRQEAAGKTQGAAQWWMPDSL